MTDLFRSPFLSALRRTFRPGTLLTGDDAPGLRPFPLTPTLAEAPAPEAVEVSKGLAERVPRMMVPLRPGGTPSPAPRPIQPYPHSASQVDARNAFETVTRRQRGLAESIDKARNTMKLERQTQAAIEDFGDTEKHAARASQRMDALRSRLRAVAPSRPRRFPRTGDAPDSLAELTRIFGITREDLGDLNQDELLPLMRQVRDVGRLNSRESMSLNKFLNKDLVLTNVELAGKLNGVVRDMNSGGMPPRKAELMSTDELRAFGDEVRGPRSGDQFREELKRRIDQQGSSKQKVLEDFGIDPKRFGHVRQDDLLPILDGIRNAGNLDGTERRRLRNRIDDVIGAKAGEAKLADYLNRQLSLAFDSPNVLNKRIKTAEELRGAAAAADRFDMIAKTVTSVSPQTALIKAIDPRGATLGSIERELERRRQKAKRSSD